MNKWILVLAVTQALAVMVEGSFFNYMPYNRGQQNNVKRFRINALRGTNWNLQGGWWWGYGRGRTCIQRTLPPITTLDDDDGLCISGCVSSNAFNLTRSTDNTVRSVQDIISDLIESPETLAQEIGVYLTILLAGEFATEVSIDGCDFVNVVNAYLPCYENGRNGRNLKLFVFKFVKRIERYIDLIASTASKQEPVTISQKRLIAGSCASGRNYYIDLAWNSLDTIVDYDYTAECLEDLEYVTRSLSKSSSPFLTGLGAGITAAVPLAQLGLFTDCLEPLVDFLYSVASCGDPVQSGLTAKMALRASYLRVSSRL